MVLKYIIIKNMGAILFPEAISHNKVGLALANAEEIESAGFAVMEDGKCVGVYGKAVSMNGLQSLPGDEHVINDTLSPASLIKYYHATTQSVREEGLEKVDKNRPGLMIVKIPEHWTKNNVEQFRDVWDRHIMSPEQSQSIKITFDIDGDLDEIPKDMPPPLKRVSNDRRGIPYQTGLGIDNTNQVVK